MIASTESLLTDQSTNDFLGVDREWVDKSCCCIRRAYFPNGDLLFCGHWRERLGRPIFVVCLYLCSYAVLLFDICRFFPTNLFNYLECGIPLFCLLCAIMSYFIALCKGPGYLPFNWSIYHRLPKTWTDEMDNIAIYQEQVDFARANSRPKRCCFSIDARRFVLRADHFCEWLKSWIGIRNHRFFMLTTLWNTLYCVTWLLAHYFWYISLVTEKFSPFSLFGIVFTFATFFLGAFCLYHFLVSLNNLSKNATILENWKKTNTSEYDIGLAKNCEEVCGSCWFFPLWIFPCFCCFKPRQTGFYEE